jgi:hypothetical protein
VLGSRDATQRLEARVERDVIGAMPFDQLTSFNAESLETFFPKSSLY